MRPYLSIIIPYHNSKEATVRLIKTLGASKKAPTFEVVLVDDASDQKITFEDIKAVTNRKKVGIRIVRLERNKGPAAARNKGAKLARGTFLLFLDSDVEVFSDTLSNLAAIYKDDPDVVAVTGVWVKEQRSQAFFPNFKALRDWSYWINERDKSGYYYLFSTRVASIKKAVFARLGGFNESYTAALVEDIELTYRIARRYAIIFAPNVRVKHEFEDFWPIAKKYFLRAFHWTRLYRQRKKFDPVATTLSEAITTLTGVATVIMGLASFIAIPTIPLLITAKSAVSPWIYYLGLLWYIGFAVSLFLHIFLIRKFLVFMAEEKGFWFSVKGFLVGLVLYCFIFAGALWGRVKS